MAANSFLKFCSISTFFKDNDSILERGEHSLHSGHVRHIEFDATLLLISGLVQSTMKSRKYKVQLYFTAEYQVKSAKCECPRGHTICHHMAATMFAAHYEFLKKDTSCSWESREPNILEFRTYNKIELPKHPSITERNLKDNAIDELLEDLNNLSPRSFSWLREPEIINESLFMVDVDSLISTKEFVDASDQQQFLREKLKLSADKIISIAEKTVGQSLNPFWFSARKLRITGSQFGYVIGCIKRNKFPATLYKRLIDEPDLSKVEAIQWGLLHEEDGLKCLEDYLDKPIRHTGIWFGESGIIGVSPDGLVDDDYSVEIKCPYSLRNTSLTEALSVDKSYIVHYDKISRLWIVNEDHIYFHQIQGQIHLTNRKAAYLVVWTPREVAIVIIDKKTEWANNLRDMESFYFTNFIPYLLQKQQHR